MKANNDSQIASIEKESVFGVVPILTREKQYRFSDAFFFLASYGIATWNYTQGAYIATLCSFKQLMITTMVGSLLVMLIFELPAILSTRYGIDIWIWIKAVLGHTGVKIVTIMVVLLNFPWHAVCAELFASSMENLVGLAGISLPSICHPLLGILCVFLGGLVAWKGLDAIGRTTRLLTPLLIAVGCIVLIVGLTSAPIDAIFNYVPASVRDGEVRAQIGYILAADGMMAYSLCWFGGMAGIPRLTYTERSGYWGGVLGQGAVGSFFVIIGAVMAIAMEYVTGVMESDPTTMLATLTFPAMALLSLVLVGFANVGTQATGSYLYAIMLKASFHKASYRLLVALLGVYVSVLCVWGKIIDYLGTFLTIGACTFAPLAALLLTDFFVIRRQKFSLRAGFEIGGNDTYRYFHGINPIGFFCIAVGVLVSLSIYNPLTGEIKIPFLFQFTPTMCCFVATGLLYWLLNCIPAVRRYNLRDRPEVTV